MTVRSAFDNFIREKRLAGLTDKSISSYEQHVSIFLQYVGDEHLLNLLTREQIDQYRESLFERGISKATISSYVRDMKIFLAWIEKEYGLDFDSKTIKVPKSPKTSPKIYSDEDAMLIFQNIKSESEWLTLRNKCMISLMYDSGLRQSEICKLKVADVDFNTNIMKVHGKGNKERLVPLGAFSKALVQKYLSVRPHVSESVFVGRYGDNVTPNTLKQLCSKIAKKLPFVFSCHKLRHNFATNFCLDLLEQGKEVDIYSLKALMGHEDIQTTECYLHIAKEIISSRKHISHLDKIMGNLA